MFIGSSLSSLVERRGGESTWSAHRRPPGVVSSLRGEVLLDELRAEVHVQLHERAVADALEAVDLAGFDHEDIACARFELSPVDHPASAALLDELHLVVRMTMRPRPGAGL